MSAIIIVIMLPYSFWILWLFASELTEKYTWSSVHGADWNSVVKMPAYGQVRLDKWGQVATGYCAFFVFGTGSDANNTYKKMLCAIGLGYIFPSLNRRSESGSSTPSSFVAARGWLSTCSSKAKDFFSRSTTVTETLQTKTVSTRNNSVTVETILLDTPRSGSFHPVATNEPMIAQQPPQASNGSKSFFGRLFPRRNRQPSVLPLFAQPRGTERTETEKSPTETLPPGIYSQAWASDSPTTAVPRDSGGGHGVHVVKELHQKDNLSDTPKE
jgi:pheromone a factor receptor